MSDNSLRISRSAAPVREQVTRVLRQAIVSGQFLPGERLTERRLCDLTDVSRTSVREALRNLESEGLVTMVPNRGPIVATLSAEEAEDIYRVRGMLEGLAAELFTVNASAEQIDQLRESIDRMEESIDATTDGVGLVKEKDRFYEVLLEGAGSPTTAAMLSSLRDRVMLLRRTTLAAKGRAKETIEELRTVMRAIEDREPEKARLASIEHVRMAASLAQEILPKAYADIDEAG